MPEQLPLHCLHPMSDWGLNKKTKEIPTKEELLKSL